MIYELLEYEVAPGRMEDFLARFGDAAIPALVRNGIQPVGCFTYGDDGPSDRFVYLVAFASHGDRDRAWASFRNDREWQDVKARTEGAEPWMLRSSSRVLLPTPFSPLGQARS